MGFGLGAWTEIYMLMNKPCSGGQDQKKSVAWSGVKIKYKNIDWCNA